MASSWKFHHEFGEAIKDCFLRVSANIGIEQGWQKSEVYLKMELEGSFIEKFFIFAKFGCLFRDSVGK